MKLDVRVCKFYKFYFVYLESLTQNFLSKLNKNFQKKSNLIENYKNK